MDLLCLPVAVLQPSGELGNAQTGSGAGALQACLQASALQPCGEGGQWLGPLLVLFPSRPAHNWRHYSLLLLHRDLTWPLTSLTHSAPRVPFRLLLCPLHAHAATGGPSSGLRRDADAVHNFYFSQLQHCSSVNSAPALGPISAT